MFEFDQSAFTQDLIGCYNTVYIDQDQTSNHTHSSDVDFFDTNPTCNNLISNQTLTPQLKSISDRVHTPARIHLHRYLCGDDSFFSQDV